MPELRRRVHARAGGRRRGARGGRSRCCGRASPRSGRSGCRADDRRAGACSARSRSSAARAPTTRRTCSWPRTSRCARARPSRTRGSTARRPRSRGRCRRPCSRRVLPDIPGAELAAAYHPAGQGLEVGGDFYDVFSTGEGQWYLVIGDVCGKGAEAAAVTALARYTIRSAAARERSPAAILRWVDEAMLSQDGAGGRFCTVACVHVDVSGPVAQADRGVRRPSAARSCAARTGQVELFGAPGTLLGLLGDVGAAGGLDGAAPRRLARALHGRAHRGARAAAHLERGRADGGGPQRRR